MAILMGTIFNDKKVLRGTILIGAFLFLSIISVSAHFFHAKYLAFVLVSLPLFFFKFNSFHFFILYGACELFFFESFLGTSYVWLFQISDACIIVFFACLVAAGKKRPSFSIPVNGLLLPLYLFIGYVAVMAIGPLFTTGPDFWLLWDCKRFLTLGLVAFFCFQPIFSPKKIIYILLTIVLFTTLHAMVNIGKFILTHERCLTWNEIYFANISIVGIILYFIISNKLLKILLASSVVLMFLGMLVAQTRTIWISTVFCLAIYLIMVLKSGAGRIKLKKIARAAVASISMAFAIYLLCEYAIGIDIKSYVVRRMVTGQRNELVDPSSSIGYRIYESYAIWKKRTLFGHGTGAYIYLVKPFKGKIKFMKWWSIHSEYFEILHKWGFVGLGLYLWFLYKFFRQSFQILQSKKKFVSSLGAIAFLSLLNTSIISLSSGYFGRVNMIFYDILLIGIVVNYYVPGNRQKNLRRFIEGGGTTFLTGRMTVEESSDGLKPNASMKSESL
jgi:hypothetical protein